MAAAPAIMMGGGALISAYGAIKKGQDEQDAYERQAYLKRLQADEMLQASEREASLTMQKAHDVQEAQQSAFGRSGIDVGSGTPLQVMAHTTSQARSEADAILHAGRYRAFTSMYEAADAELLGNNARESSYYTAIGSVFSAGGQYAKASGAL